MTKRITAMLLAVVLVLSCVVAPVEAAADLYTIRLADTNGNHVVSVQAGDTVTLYLSLENNPGITGVGVGMEYPAALSLAQQPNDISNLHEIAEVTKEFSENLTDNPYVMWWNLALGDFNRKLITQEGNLAEITFKVADDAASCVAYGCGKSLAWINHMQEGPINIARKRLMRGI